MTFETLTRRESQIMTMVAAGATSPQIGAALAISPRTVEVHRANAIAKLGARNATQAAVIFDRAQAERIVEVAA